jgi:hypothetical protein
LNNRLHPGAWFVIVDKAVLPGDNKAHALVHKRPAALTAQQWLDLSPVPESDEQDPRTWPHAITVGESFGIAVEIVIVPAYDLFYMNRTETTFLSPHDGLAKHISTH